MLRKDILYLCKNFLLMQNHLGLTRNNVDKTVRVHAREMIQVGNTVQPTT